MSGLHSFHQYGRAFADACFPHFIRNIPKNAVQLCKFVGNYAYYRKQKYCRSIAWQKARNTI